MRYSPDGKWLQVGRWWVRISDGYRLPVIQGGTTPVVVQVTHRFIDDDGDLDNATLLGAGNGEDLTRGTGTANRFRIRIRIEETAGGNFVLTGSLWFSYEGGAYEAMSTTSDHIRAVASANTTWTITDDDAITANRLGAGSGTWEDGHFDANGVVESVIGLKSEYTEVEYCLYIDDATVNDGDTIDLRVYDTDTELSSYTDTPRITVSKGVADPLPEVSDNITLADTPDVTPLVLPNLEEADNITLADTVVDIAITGPPDRDLPVITDGLTVGESVSVSMPDALAIDVSDGLTIGEDTTVSIPGGIVEHLDFEENDKTDFDSESSGTYLSVSASAGMVGSYGLEVDFTSANGADPYGTNNFTIGTETIRYRFYIDVTNISMTNGDTFQPVIITSTQGSINMTSFIVVNYNGSVIQARGCVVEDNDNPVYTAYTTITGEHYIEMLVERESTSTADDGTAEIWVDGVSKDTLSSLENFAKFNATNGSDFGAQSLDTGSTGTLYLDDLIVRDDSQEIGAADQDPQPSVSDGITIGESITIAMSDSTLLVSDDITLGDSPTVSRQDATTRTIDVTDGLTIGESVSAELDDLAIDVSDGITVGETTSAEHELDLSVDVSDGLTIGESTTAEHDDEEISVSDGITVGESVSAALDDEEISVSDGITLGEYTELNLPEIGATTVSVSDNIVIGESTTAALDDEEISVSDGLTIGEDTTVSRQDAVDRSIDVSDDITLGESTTAEHDDLTIDVSDGITVGDAPNVVRTVEGEYYVNVSDGITIGESTSAELDDLSLSVTDDIALGENVTASLDDLTFSVTDDITLGEDTTVSVGAPGATSISVSDGIVIGENTSVTISDPTLSISDGLVVGDSAAVSIEATADYSISVSDGLVIGESITSSLPDALELSLVDNITIADAPELALLIGIVESWTLQSRSLGWTIEERDLDWSIQDRSTAWTVEDR